MDCAVDDWVVNKMKILCALGKYQYGDPARGFSTEYAAFMPALKNMGHDVVHFELWDRRTYSNYAELNHLILKAVDRECPEVLLTVQLQYEIFIETLETIKNRGDVATICWATDDSWKYREVSRFIGRYYHAMTTTYPEVVSKYHRDGISHILLTQWAARSNQLVPPLLSHECRYPVSFIGEAHGNRRQRIQYLLDQGIPVACFGHGWPHGPVSADDVPKIMRNSVISLNFANSRGQQNQIKARTFEVPGAGGFLLTEPAPYLDNWYIPDQEIVVFQSDRDLVQKIKYYLSHPAIRDRIAAAGFERTCNDHTYEKRLQLVLGYALNAKNADVRNPGEHPAKRMRNDAFSFTCRLSPSKAERLSHLIRQILVWGCNRIWGQTRGLRAARRIIFELSWRLAKEKTFSQSGWPARMFPEL
ncbi:MAG: glycosyltransferase [Pseudomonadota bacterium]